MPAGLTDMLDGPVARHTHTQSSAGVRLDSLVDLAFTGVCLFRLLPLLHPPRWLTGWIAGILILRLCNLGTGLLRHKRLMLLHTRANKLTGLLLFGLVFLLTTPYARPASALVCAWTTAASLQEGYLLCRGKAR
nr:CDP-alcohol phosphatidyltransferase family protein [uncultured Ruminococcus sp.]